MMVMMIIIKLAVVSHFSNSISQTTTFWDLRLGFFTIRVILKGKLGLYMEGVRFWRNGLGEVGHNQKWQRQ